MTTKPKILRRTAIEWTDYPWNPVRARDRITGKPGWHCDHASDGCRNCYAETINNLRGTGLAYTHQNLDRVEVFLSDEWLNARTPRRSSKIFMCDITDLFADFVVDAWLDRIFAVVEAHPRHVFQVLTKRPTRMRDYFSTRPPLPNLWLGTSIEQRRHKNRLSLLRATPAAIRFVSFEPLLEDLGPIDLSDIGWVIAGAESDPLGRARPMQLDWVRGIRDQCVAADVPFFFKQDAVNGKKLPLPFLDGRQWRAFPIA
jgi:protein gp37